MALKRAKPANRDKTGKFVKGKSGNPSGRPTLPADLKIMCQGRAEDAINTALEILDDSEQPAAARLKAAEIILDRGYGKASQTITGDAENPVAVQIVEVVRSSE